MALSDYLQDIKPEFLTVSATLSVCILAFLILRWVVKRKNFPPGPMGLPIVGYLPFLTKNVHLKLMDLGKKYGEVFSVRLGSEAIVILNSANVIREAFSKSEFLGRPPHTSFSLFDSNSPFFDTNIHVWQEQRRFVVQSMKDLGLGKSKIEGHILEEISNFLEVLNKHNGEPFDVMTPLTPSMSNNISSLVFGKRYEYNDPERVQLDKSLNDVEKALGQAAFHVFFPWIRYFPLIIKWMKLDDAVESSKKLLKIFAKKAEEHKKTLDPRDIRDFIDSYLIEMEVRRAKDPQTTFSDESLKGCVFDLFGAGTETVRTTISWSLYIMAAFPDIQKKVQKEIMDILGTEKNPEFQIQKEMPYSHAVLLEIMRWKTIVPLNLLRYTLAATTVAGYDIPKDTIVMANIWASHHDPKVWDDPGSFKPERFLGQDGKSVIKPKHFLPFSVGKRACPGETMAYMEVFLYFVSILQKFDITLPDDKKPTFDAKLGITYKLNPHKLRFIPKH
ncbi:Cytochrome P450 2J2, partial [Stegodyphus mimosarum]